MSPWKAPAICCSKVGTLAFQPNLPSRVSPALTFQAMLARPDMPSPLASSGSVSARISVVGYGFEETASEHRRGDTRGKQQVGVRGAESQFGE